MNASNRSAHLRGVQHVSEAEAGALHRQLSNKLLHVRAQLVLLRLQRAARAWVWASGQRAAGQQLPAGEAIAHERAAWAREDESPPLAGLLRTHRHSRAHVGLLPLHIQLAHVPGQAADEQVGALPGRAALQQRKQGGQAVAQHGINKLLGLRHRESREE